MPVTPASIGPPTLPAPTSRSARSSRADAVPRCRRRRPLARVLAHVAHRLLTESERAAAAPEIVVLRDPTISAFVLPSGRIYLHTGLLARLGSEAQLATILARALVQVEPPRRPRRLQAAPGKVPEALPAVRSTIGTALATDTGWSVMSPVAEAILGGNLERRLRRRHHRIRARGSSARPTPARSSAWCEPATTRRRRRRTFERLRREAQAGRRSRAILLGRDAALAERVDGSRPRGRRGLRRRGRHAGHGQEHR